MKLKVKFKFEWEVKFPKLRLQDTAASMTIGYYLAMFIGMLSGLL